MSLFHIVNICSGEKCSKRGCRFNDFVLRIAGYTTNALPAYVMMLYQSAFSPFTARLLSTQAEAL